MIGAGQQRMRRMVVLGLVVLGLMGMRPEAGWSAAMVWPVQMPYEAPPKSEPVPDVSVAPNTKALTVEELQRAESLLPLLEGKQEFWAMGEFVHLGEPVLPVLTKALTMPGPRIRYNAIETMSMIKAPAATPALLKRPNWPPKFRVSGNMRYGSPCDSTRSRRLPPSRPWRRTRIR